MAADQKRQILMNPDVIAIDQDALGRAGDRIYNSSTGAQVWAKELVNGDKAVVLFNAHNHNTVAANVSWTSVRSVFCYGLPCNVERYIVFYSHITQPYYSLVGQRLTMYTCATCGSKAMWEHLHRVMEYRRFCHMT